MPEYPQHPLSITLWPAPILSQKSATVEVFDAPLHALIEAMIEAMYNAEGVGLAAPQVGVPLRLFVADVRSEGEFDPVVFINPRLELEGEWTSEEEGCLSIPDVRVQVRRPLKATIHALDHEGNGFSLTSETLAARVWQHENDHLEGVLIVDRMSPLDRLATRRTLKELRAAATAFGFDP